MKKESHKVRILETANDFAKYCRAKPILQHHSNKKINKQKINYRKPIFNCLSSNQKVFSLGQRTHRSYLLLLQRAVGQQHKW